MRTLVIALMVAALAGCSPPAAETPAEPPPAPAAPAADLGPYTNSWSAAEPSRFRHTLHAATPGEVELTLVPPPILRAAKPLRFIQ